MKKEDIRNILYRIELKRKNLLRPYFLDMGLTIGQGQPRILKCLLEEEPMTQKELAVKCIRDTATMSRTLDRLQETGLIEREENPECRRSYLVRLTPEGRQKAQEVQKVFAMVDERIWKETSGGEMELLYGVLRKIEKNLTED